MRVMRMLVGEDYTDDDYDGDNYNLMMIDGKTW
jgi:hypothetical protein